MDNKPQLSSREIDILKYKAMGFKTNDIAKKIFISPKTVEHHWNRVLLELGCKNNSIKAIYKAYECGLIIPPLYGELNEALVNIKNANKLVAQASEILKQFNQSVESDLV
jgi:DNA-binding CsgD family transcriptional regulator